MTYSFESDGKVTLSLAGVQIEGTWKQDGVSLEHDAENSDENDEIKIFQKGQFIKYDINYWDYEDDPSKQSFLKDTHTPSNDGEFEKAAVILDKDGNITVSYRQLDVYKRQYLGRDYDSFRKGGR